MSLKSRTEINASPISNGGGNKTVTFDKAFYAGSSNTDITSNAPRVSISMSNESNKVVTVTNVTSTQFQVDIKDSSGNYVTTDFNYSAVGFGTISS